MNRKLLKEKELTPEQIDFIMEEKGKMIELQKMELEEAITKAVNQNALLLNKEIEELKKQNGELQETIKNSTGSDEETKRKIEDLTKMHSEQMQKLALEAQEETARIKKESDIELMKLQRISGTKDFLNTLDKKFITPETAKAFEDRLNEALSIQENEGKNRSDLFAALIKNDKGEDRTDIFMQAMNLGTQVPNVASGSRGISEGITDDFLRGFNSD